MIELHSAPTPNGRKVAIMLAECGLTFALHPVQLQKGEQFRPGFLAISPNNRIPAIVDLAPGDGGAPVSVFESGAILLYLAEKTGRFLPQDLRGRHQVMQWLFWQMAGLGPMLGQHGHFKLYAEQQHPYALDRYAGEARRLYSVLDAQLKRTGQCVAGDYSIADMACFPWVMTHKAQGFTLDDWPHVKRWYATLRARPLLQAGLLIGKDSDPAPRPLDATARHNLFGGAASTTPR